MKSRANLQTPEKAFALLYTAASVLLWVSALPFLLLLSLKAKYRTSIPARFFLWKNGPLPADRIWFHACSLGETRALVPVIEHVGMQRCVLSTTTQTGQAAARALCGAVRYLPFEPLLWFWVKPSRALVVMEAEYWYLMFFIARLRGARTILLNARMSERSFGKYLKFGWFYRKIFACIDTVYAQSDADAARLARLGARNVRVIGNIKLAKPPAPSKTYEKPGGIVVTAASTHEGEEEGILKAFGDFSVRHPGSRLLLVPRHPERFEKVVRMAEAFAAKRRLRFSRFSREHTFESDIVVIDAMGELVNMMAISHIIILGGAFAPIGGHNPAEALPFGCRLISGHHIFNQRAMFGALRGVLFAELSELSEVLESAVSAPPISLKQSVDLTPFYEELADVV